MLTIGLVDLRKERLDYVPTRLDGWKLVQLAHESQERFERSLRNSTLDAVAIIGSCTRKTLLAKKALLQGKPVLVDFPPADSPLRITELTKLATKAGQPIYSPNLLRNEQGLKELKQRITLSAGAILSLTIMYGANIRPNKPELTMKTIQVLDTIEWLCESSLDELITEKTSNASSTGLVTLASLDNGVKVLLNICSAAMRGYPDRFWIDAVFSNGVVHVDPRAQSIRITSFRDGAVKTVNWGTSSLVVAIENFTKYVRGEVQSSGLENADRIFKLARKVLES
ncbi:MAG TPA: hypothetical protein VLV31_05800 [Candidatus Acidoferrales bacterium]|nr:hypothetical protein [Candidatus Acidoferrales bacterium]